MKTNTPKPIELVTRQTKLWNEFRRLTLKVHETLDPADGIAAGKAWRDFVNDFLDVETRDKLEAITFPNRGARV